MPNGDDKNWVRICSAIDGFRSRYGRWPKSVRLPPDYFENVVGHVLTPSGFALVSSVFTLASDCGLSEEVAIIAQDDSGAEFRYGDDSGFFGHPELPAMDYFGQAIIRSGLDDGLSGIRIDPAKPVQQGAAVSSDQILEAFHNMKCRTGGPDKAQKKSPHKPLLVLYALGRLRQGEDRLSFADSAGDLDRLLQDFGPGRGPEMPFWRLKNDGVWDVTWNGPENVEQPNRQELEAGNCKGGFSSPVLAALRSDPGLLERVAQLILEAHFSAVQHGSIRERVGLSGKGYTEG